MRYDKHFFTTLIGIFVVVLVVSVAGCTSSSTQASPTTAAPSVATATPAVAKQTHASSTAAAMAKATPSQTSLTPSSQQYTGPFVGSKNSNVYHIPSCFEAKKIKPQNQVWFPNAKAAQAAGYRPCKVCEPETTV